MSEIQDFFRKADNKLKSGKYLYEFEQYSTAVSVCYYAMFLCAKALLINRHIDPGKSHNGLIHKFNYEFVHKDNFDKDVYKYFASTQALREEADYDAYDEITKSIAEKRIQQAEIFINECKKFV